MFDTLLYTKKLEAAGMTRDQAEAQVNVIAEMVVDGVATKQDIGLLKAETQKEFAELRLEMAKGFADVRTDMDRGLASVRADMEKGLASVRADMEKGFASIRAEMQEGLAALRSEMQREIASIRMEMAAFDAKLVSLEYRLTLRMGAMFAASTSITIAVLAWIK
ncbi:MAG: CCDC90 family protein [Bdellovibrio sp.]|nr:CCDC90 family protein [Bdellovibrio sp.]